MDCSKVKDLLYRFVDNELDDEGIAFLEEHLRDCPLCDQEVDKEKKFDCLVRKHFPREDIPLHVRENILDLVRGKQEQAPRAVYPGLALAAVFTFLIVFGALKLYRMPDIFDKTLIVHTNIIRNIEPEHTGSKNIDQAVNMLQSEVDFSLKIPDLSFKGAQLEGAQITRIDNRQVVNLTYRKDDRIISVFIFEALKSYPLKARKVTIDRMDYFLVNKKGFNSVLCTENGITCIFVSDIPEAELVHMASLKM